MNEAYFALFSMGAHLIGMTPIVALTIKLNQIPSMHFFAFMAFCTEVIYVIICSLRFITCSLRYLSLWPTTPDHVSPYIPSLLGYFFGKSLFFKEHCTSSSHSMGARDHCIVCRRSVSW